MGIFNFTIAMPQIICALTAGFIVSYVFNDNAVYIIVVAGVSMLLAGLSVFGVKEHVQVTE